jgi:Flp pilus assembly protein TadG
MRLAMQKGKCQRGAVAVEFGLLLIPLVLLAFGITEYGRALYQYNALGKAVRGAVRYLSEQTPGEPAPREIAECLAVYAAADCSGTPVVPGLTRSMVSVCDMTNCPTTHANQSTGPGSVNLVTVTISGFPFMSLVPAMLPNITFGAISATMRQAT